MPQEQNVSRTKCLKNKMSQGLNVSRSKCHKKQMSQKPKVSKTKLQLMSHVPIVFKPNSKQSHLSNASFGKDFQVSSKFKCLKAFLLTLQLQKQKEKSFFFHTVEISRHFFWYATEKYSQCRMHFALTIRKKCSKCYFSILQYWK